MRVRGGVTRDGGVEGHAAGLAGRPPGMNGGTVVYALSTSRAGEGGGNRLVRSCVEGGGEDWRRRERWFASLGYVGSCGGAPKPRASLLVCGLSYWLSVGKCVRFGGWYRYIQRYLL